MVETQTSDSFISIIIEIECKLLHPPAPVYAHEQPGPAIPLHTFKTSGGSTGLNPYPLSNMRVKLNCLLNSLWCCVIGQDGLTGCKSFTRNLCLKTIQDLRHLDDLSKGGVHQLQIRDRAFIAQVFIGLT